MTSDEDEVITVAPHPALRQPFEQWLALRNCRLVRVPDENPFYIVTPDGDAAEEPRQ